MSEPFFSLVIPVHNGGASFLDCLTAVYASTFTDWELIIVNDGSTDSSVAIAEQFATAVFHTSQRSGPAAARNLGASHARGRYLFFTDADCQLHPDTLAKAAAILKASPNLDALIGSYDDAPAAPNLVSQYKNLLHHYIHQTNSPQATTFWTGCGAIKQNTFTQLGGFAAQRYPRASIEDIELGYRLIEQNGRIRLAKDIQVKHLKTWHLTTLIRSDIFDRGVPWMQLILERGRLPSDLNLRPAHRLSVIISYGLLATLPFPRQAKWPFFFFLTSLIGLNSQLYRFFIQKRGLTFTLQAILLHWLYYLYNAFSVLYALWLRLKERDSMNR